MFQPRGRHKVDSLSRRFLVVGFTIGWITLAVAGLTSLGCTPPGGGGGDGQGQGAGHRAQTLVLTPEQEEDLGKQAYEQILKKYPVVEDGEEVERVREVGKRIARASEIEPLQREINLHLQGYHFEWEFKVLKSDQINAFCLPGGKVGVFTGLLGVVQNDSQLATVMGHEAAHALAHHSNERIAREQKEKRMLEAVNGSLGSLPGGERRLLIGLLSGGAELHSLKYDRQQESEADHIGVFLMTFAGYDPKQSVVFWERMTQATQRMGHPPAILSTHPSDAQRMKDLQGWIPMALGGKKQFDAGHIAPPR